MRQRFSNVVFTVNNYTYGDIELLATCDWWSYLVVGAEEGREGTPHLQGYMELKSRKRLHQLLRVLPRAHIEPRRGSAMQASEYCKKDGDFFEAGELSNQGARYDLVALRRRVDAGESFRDIVRDCGNYNTARMCQLLCGMRKFSHKYKKPVVYWLHGGTGTGKTRTAMENCPAGDTWHAFSGEWFDGYYGEKYVIIDELRAKNWPYDLMLRLLDGYQLRLPIKGAFTVWKPKVIYITAPLPPQNTYHGQLEYHGSIDQLLRRIDHIVDFDVTPHKDCI